MNIKSFLIYLLVLMMLLTGCVNAGDNHVPSDSSNAAQQNNDENSGGIKKDSLIYAMSGEPKSIDPAKANEFIVMLLCRQAYDCLVRIESNGDIVPGLAESWELTDGGKSVIFHLRKDVKFHNGDLLTVDDVVFSLNRSIESSYTTNITSMMDFAEKVDEDSVKLALKFPFGSILSCVGHPACSITSKKAVEEMGEDKYAKNPVGTGPFKLVEWQSGDKLTFERFEEYWKEPAVLKTVEFKIIADKSTGAIALENGEIDVLDTPANADRLHLMECSNLSYYEVPAAATTYIAFQNEEGIFSDKRLRLAVAHAIDYESMLLGAVEGVGTICDTFPARSVWGYPENIEKLPYDPEKSKQLMVEAGYPNGFSVTLYTTDSDTYYKPTEVLQDQLKKVGINAEISKLERGAFLNTTKDTSNYEISVLATSAPYPDIDYLYPMFHSFGITNGKNHFRNNTPELDKMLDDARIEQDEEKRKEMYNTIFEFIRDEAITVPLYSYMTGVCANKELKGIQAHPYNVFYLYDYFW